MNYTKKHKVSGSEITVEFDDGDFKYSISSDNAALMTVFNRETALVLNGLPVHPVEHKDGKYSFDVYICMPQPNPGAPPSESGLKIGKISEEVILEKIAEFLDKTYPTSQDIERKAAEIERIERLRAGGEKDGEEARIMAATEHNTRQMRAAIKATLDKHGVTRTAELDKALDDTVIQEEMALQRKKGNLPGMPG